MKRLRDAYVEYDKKHPFCEKHSALPYDSCKIPVTVHTTRSLAAVFLYSKITKVHITIVNVDPDSPDFVSEECDAENRVSITGIYAYESFSEFVSFEVAMSSGSGLFPAVSVETFTGKYTLPETQFYSICVPDFFLHREDWELNKCHQCWD